MNAAAGCTRAASRLACVSLDEGVGGAAALGAVLAATSTVLAALAARFAARGNGALMCHVCTYLLCGRVKGIRASALRGSSHETRGGARS